jgi:hypothetical protein
VYTTRKQFLACTGFANQQDGKALARRHLGCERDYLTYDWALTDYMGLPCKGWVGTWTLNDRTAPVPGGKVRTAPSGKTSIRSPSPSAEGTLI